MLSQIDQRAKDLGVGRSRYLVWLAQHDLAKGGELTVPLLKNLPPSGLAEPPLPPDRPDELAKFLKFAIPALDDFNRNLGNPGAIQSVTLPPGARSRCRGMEFFPRRARGDFEAQVD